MFIFGKPFADNDSPSPSSGNSDENELKIYENLNPKSRGAQTGFSYQSFEEDISTVPILSWQALLASRKLRSRFGVGKPDNSSDGALAASENSNSRRSDAFAQYSLLGFRQAHNRIARSEEPIFLNTNTPWSAFICGSQGSGKSYTLSCMLENCLYSSTRIGKLQKPLAGVVFHYDTYSGGQGDGGICEAAHLCSLGIPVHVLVPETNSTRLSALYKGISGARRNLHVSTLKFRSKHLNIERLQTLMAFSDTSAVPLYMAVCSALLTLRRRLSLILLFRGADVVAKQSNRSLQ